MNKKLISRMLMFFTFCISIIFNSCNSHGKISSDALIGHWLQIEKGKSNHLSIIGHGENLESKFEIIIDSNLLLSFYANGDLIESNRSCKVQDSTLHIANILKYKLLKLDKDSLVFIFEYSNYIPEIERYARVK